MIGALFREVFQGTFFLLADPLVERAATFHLVVHLDRLRDLAQRGLARVDGTVSLEGLADGLPLEGRVLFRLRTEKRVPYDLTTTRADGHRLRIRAQREPHPLRPQEVITDFRFSLYDEEEHEMGRGVARTELRAGLAAAARSLRLRLL